MLPFTHKPNILINGFAFRNYIIFHYCQKLNLKIHLV